MDRMNSTPNPQLPTLSCGVVATVTVPITEEPVQVSTDSTTISTSITTRPLEPVLSYAEMLKLCQPKNVSEAADSKKSAVELPMTSVTVKRGDSVWSLLLAQGFSGGEIFSQNLIKLVADKNSLANANHITVGQSLQVPTKGEQDDKKPETTTTRRRRPAPTQRTPKPQVLRRPVVQRRTTPAQTPTPKQTQTPTQTQTPVQNRPQPKQPQQPTRKTDWGGFGGGGGFDGGGAGGSW